jgi:hypothetical protein
MPKLYTEYPSIVLPITFGEKYSITAEGGMGKHVVDKLRSWVGDMLHWEGLSVA